MDIDRNYTVCSTLDQGAAAETSGIRGTWILVDCLWSAPLYGIDSSLVNTVGSFNGVNAVVLQFTPKLAPFVALPGLRLTLPCMRFALAVLRHGGGGATFTRLTVAYTTEG